MKKKILLAILIIVVLLGVGVAYAYFATDTFKSNKEMFFSYLSDGLKNKELEEYIKKQEKESYTNKGNIKISASGEDNELDADTTQMLNNGKITFEGKVNNGKKLAEQTVTVESAEGINIPVKVRRDGDKLGLQSNLLNNKFIAIKNENLKSLVERFNINSEEIPDKIDFEGKQFTEDELKTLKDRYVSILSENLEEELFSKEKVEGQIIVTLNVSEKKCSEILVKILETLREDDIILNKISDVVDKDEFKENINDEIDEIKDINSSESNTLCIKVYISSKDVKKVEIILNDVDENKTIGQLEITKDQNEKDLTYVVKANGESEDGEEVSIDFKVQYKNISELNNVEENYEIKLKTKDNEDNVEISLNYTNLKTFNTDVEIEGINNDNSTIVNDASDDELNDLLMTIYKKLGLMDEEDSKDTYGSDEEDSMMSFFQNEF